MVMSSPRTCRLLARTPLKSSGQNFLDAAITPRPPGYQKDMAYRGNQKICQRRRIQLLRWALVTRSLFTLAKSAADALRDARQNG